MIKRMKKWLAGIMAGVMALVMVLPLVVTAGAANVYTVTVVGNGGTYTADGSTSKTFEYDPESMYVFELNARDWEAPNGKVFMGWATDEFGSNLNESELLSLSPSSDETWYLIWKDVYTVTLDANGGVFSDGSSTKTESGDYIGMIEVPVLSGKALVGWSYSAGGPVEIWGTSYLGITPDSNLILYAVWQDAYNITLDANGGSFSDGLPTKQKQVASGNEVGNVEEPSMGGKMFTGWSTSATGTADVPYNNGYCYYWPETDKILYAVWANPVTITLDANGGYFNDYYGNTNLQTFSFETAQGMQIGSYEAYLLNNDPDVFVKSWTDQDGNEISDISSYVPDRNTTLTAQWSKKLNVILDANGGAFDDGSTTRSASAGSNGLEWIGVPVLSGKVLTGWSYSAGGSENLRGESGYCGFMPSADMTLYAVWKDPHTVVLDANGGCFPDGSTAYSVVVAPGNNIGFFGSPSMNDKLLAGWSTSAAGSANVIYDTNSLYWLTPTADMMLYAVWSDPITVTLDANGGQFINAFGYPDVSTYSFTVAAGKKLNSGEVRSLYISDPKKYVKSWTDPDGNVVSGTNASLTDYAPSEDITLTVQWGDNYTVTYEYNNGNQPFTDYYHWDSMPTAYENMYMVNGDKTFTGWFTDAECTKKAVWQELMNKDSTVYAGWSDDAPETVTVTWHPSPGTMLGQSAGSDTYTNTYPKGGSLRAFEFNPPAGYLYGGLSLTPGGPRLNYAGFTLETDIDLYFLWIEDSQITDSTGLWKYRLEADGTVCVIDYLGSSTDLTIPGTLDGLEVTRVDFSEWTKGKSLALTSLKVPDSVTSIGGNLSGMTSLQEAVLGEGLLEIPYMMFQGCSSLADLTLPSGLTLLGSGCLQESGLTDVTLPDSVTNITGNAFYKSGSLQSIDMGNSVENLGYSAFYGCTALENVTIGSSVKTIDDCCFGDCPALTKIVFEGELPLLKGNAFAGITATGYYPEEYASQYVNLPNTLAGAANITWVEVPAPTPTATPTPTPTPTPEVTPTDTPTPTPEVTPTETPTPTPAATPTETPTPTPAATPTETPTPTPEVTPTETPTPSPEVTPTETPTPTPEVTPTETPTPTPAVTPTETPTSEPTETPIPAPVSQTDISAASAAGAPAASVSADITALTSALTAQGLLTEDEQKKIEEGADLDIILVVDDAANTISASDKAAIENAASGMTIGQLLEIDLFKQVTQNGVKGSQVQLTSSGAPLTITLAIPDSLKQNDGNIVRTYYVVRVHDGRAQILETTDNGNGTISFASSLFSAYAIAYKDVKKAPAPTPAASANTAQNTDTTAKTAPADTGDDNHTVIWIAIIFIAAAAMTAMLLARRKMNR